MRKAMIAGATAMALVLNGQHARADITDGQMEDVLEEALEPLVEAVEGLFEMIEFIITTGEMPPMVVNRHLNEILALFGVSRRSYIPNGSRGVLDDLHPDDPEWVTIGDAKWYIEERLEDRKERVNEAMDVAATITRQVPDTTAQLEVLSAANKVPVGTTATLQVGNEIALESAGALNKMNGLLAELGQLEADQRTQEDWQRVMSFNWAEYHYRDTAFWTGSRSWAPDPVDAGW